jgi:TRAP transporter TAXI family solute receptor
MIGVEVKNRRKGKTMKKLYLIPFLIILVVGLIVSGCAQPAPAPGPGPAPAPTPAPAPPPKDWPKLTFITTSSGTNPHTMAVAWTTLASKYVPGMQFTIEPAVGAPQAVNGFFEGTGDLVYNPANLTRGASNKYIPGKTLAAAPHHLITTLGSAIHIVARAETGIESIADFKGKKILAKVPRARANDEARLNILAANDMTDDDIVLLNGNNGKHLAEQLREGVGEAAMIFLGLGDSSIVELCTMKDIRWIPLSPEEMTWAEKQWVKVGSIPANTYPKQTEAVSAIRLPGSFSVRSSMDEEAAYTLVKVLYDHWDEFVQMAPIGKDWELSADNAAAGYLPFHPGAIKYYKEKNVWTSEAEANNQKLLKKEIPAAKPGP